MPKRRNAAAKRNPAASRSTKARTTRGTRRSPDRMRERDRRHYGGQAYDTMAYGKPDVASLGDPESGHWFKQAYYRGKSTKAQALQPSPEWRGGRGNYDDPTVPTRRMAGGRPRIGGGSNAVDARRRRRASTQDSLRRADASMFNYDD